MPDLPKLAKVGDRIQCDLHFPYPHTHTERLVTVEAAAFANELLMNPASGWRLADASGVPLAVRVHAYGGSTGVNDYLMTDGTIKPMRPAEVKWATGASGVDTPDGEQR